MGWAALNTRAPPMQHTTRMYRRHKRQGRLPPPPTWGMAQDTPGASQMSDTHTTQHTTPLVTPPPPRRARAVWVSGKTAHHSLI